MQIRPHRLSKKGAEFIAGFEGFVDHPYNDPAGNSTIGYGHLIHIGRVKPSDLSAWGYITHDQAIGLLLSDAQDAADAVLGAVRPSFLFQWRFDALVSFVYNLGPGILGPNWAIIHHLNSGKLRRGAANALLLYDSVAGQRVPGLTRRRNAE